ncbi:hypothetical protein LSAT2_009191 [Lamellibrachia satsuma]|nr:hypothetical protein LSAT2_009191 [Lamellibrachia satsuma]
MAMSTLKDRFNNPQYVNWVKLSQALLCVRDGLAPFCEGVIREIHDSLKLKIDPELQEKTCTVGSHKVVKRRKTPNKEQQWFSGCSNNICNAWLGVIVESFPTEWYTWNNCDVSKLPTESWQLAKLFMDFGQDPSNAAAAKTDPLGLLQLVINCKKFHHSRLEKHLAEKIEHVALTIEGEVKLLKEIIVKCKDNKEAILKFVTSYKDLEESLRPEIEQLKREVKEIKDELAGQGKKIFQMSMQVMENTEHGNSNEIKINQLTDKLDQLINLKPQERPIPETQMNLDQTTRSRESVQGSIDTLQDQQRDTPTPVTSVEYPGKGNADQEEEDNQPFHMYDVVTIEEDKDRVKQLQEDRAIWEPSMTSVLGLTGIVNKINDDGNVFVECNSGTKYWFNPKLLNPVDTSNTTVGIGDFVLVIDSHETVKALQDKEHGGWVENMRKNLGTTGIVLSILPNECATIFIDGRRWTYNLKALRHIAKSGSLTSNTTSDDASSSDSNEHETFGMGEQVLVESDQLTAIRLQEYHGDWVSKMEQNFKPKRKKKRGSRGGVRNRLKKRGCRLPLPAITLSNVHSLQNKMDKLSALTKYDGDYRRCSLFCFTETWLTEDVSDMNLPG